MNIRRTDDQNDVRKGGKRTEPSARPRAPQHFGPLIRIDRKRGLFPASSTQARLYELEKLDPRHHLANVVIQARLEGQLDSAALEAAVRFCANRHEAFKTTFHKTPNGILQHIENASSLDFIRIDMVARGHKEARCKMDTITRSLMTMPFDLEHGPLVRVIETRFAPQRVYLTCHSHHIISDAYSGLQFLREMFQAYDAVCLGQPPGLPEVEFHFLDFTVWQERCLSDTMTGAAEYWRRHLRGSDNHLALFGPRRRCSRSAIDLGVQRRSWSVTCQKRIRSLARLCRSSEFVVLFCAFLGLVHLFTRKHRPAVAVPFANRFQRGAKSIVGFLANVLPVVTAVSAHTSLIELMDQVGANMREIRNYRLWPADKITLLTHPDKSWENAPLSNVLFNYFRYAEPDFHGGSIRGTLAWELCTPVLHYWYDFAFYLYSEQNGRRRIIDMLYYRDVLCDEEAARVLDTYVAILEAWTISPKMRLSEMKKGLA